MSTADILATGLVVNSALTTGALVYTVRRVSPWPKPPPPPPVPPSAGPSASQAGAQ